MRRKRALPDDIETRFAFLAALTICVWVLVRLLWSVLA